MEYSELVELGRDFLDRINSDYIRQAMRDLVKSYDLTANEAWALNGIIESGLRVDLAAGVAQANPRGMYDDTA